MPDKSKLRKLRNFINDFNYPNPIWEDFPKGFPNCDTSGLTPHEEGLFSGIVLVWYANYGGRKSLYRKFTQSMLFVTAVLASAMMIKNILVSDMFTRAVTVNAATVSGTLRSVNVQRESEELPASPSKILESTASGLLREEISD